MDVIVIGAGVAGLAAAQQIRRAGHEVTVLEARDRIGGRIHTLRPADWPLPVEAGAEFIHGRPPELRAFMPAHVERSTDRPSRGMREDLWRRVMKKIVRLPTKRDRSMKQAFSTAHWKQHTTLEERGLGVAYVEGFNAARLDRASVKAIVQQTRVALRIETGRTTRLPHGYDAVPLRLADGLRIVLNAPVQEIRWERGKVTVLAGGLTHEAERAVITLPLGVLQAGTVRFTPALPAWKRQAIHSLAMGPVVKVALLFESAVCPEDTDFLFAPGAPVPTFWRMQPTNAAAMMGWAASLNALRLEGKDATALAVDSLSSALGKRVRPTRSLVFDWQLDPYAHGAYSWVPAGAFAAQRELARRVGPLHFAGEAADFAGACGTVHGAIRTGLHAAHEVLARKR